MTRVKSRFEILSKFSRQTPESTGRGSDSWSLELGTWKPLAGGPSRPDESASCDLSPTHLMDEYDSQFRFSTDLSDTADQQ